jgi:aryl-alcohol dehydrogenase-like predicted oxidoreductase
VPGRNSIAWTRANQAVTGAIVGFGDVKQVKGMIGAAASRLSLSELDEIASQLRTDAAA